MVEFKKAPEGRSPIVEARDAAADWLATVIGRAHESVVALTGPELARLVYLLIVLALLLGVYFRRRRSRAQSPWRRPPCRWRENKWRANSSLVQWRCWECGVDAYTMNRKPPRECKRDLRDTAL